MHKVSPDRLEDEGAARMAEMAFVVDRDAADVHLRHAGGQRLEGFFFPGERVMDLQHKMVRGVYLVFLVFWVARNEPDERDKPEKPPFRRRAISTSHSRSCSITSWCVTSR